MDIFQLSCFLTVAETLNFAQAAQQLSITQPAVTHQIRSLEQELGVKLFHRTTRTVKLTEAGVIFLNDAQHMVAIARRAKKRFENPYDQEFQVLSIGCHSYTHLFLLADVLQQMAQQYTDLHPRLRVVPFQHLYRLLQEDEVDAIIGFQEPDDKKVPGTFLSLQKVPVACVCAAGHSLARRQVVHLEELTQEKLVLLDPLRAVATVAQLQGQLMGGRSPDNFYFCESAEAATVLTKAGFGISILPDLMVPPDPGLVSIPLEGLEPVSFGVYYRTLQGNAPLRSFVHLLKGLFPPDDPPAAHQTWEGMPQT